MKKVVAIILVSLCLFSMTSCTIIGKKDKETVPTKNSKSGEDALIEVYTELFEYEYEKSGGYAAGLLADFDDDNTAEILIINDIYRTVYELCENEIVWVEDLSGRNVMNEYDWEVIDYLWNGKNVYMHRISGEKIHIDGEVVGIEVQGELFVYENGQKKILFTQKTTNDLYWINGKLVDLEEYENANIFDYIPGKARYIEEYWDSDEIVDLRKIRVH